MWIFEFLSLASGRISEATWGFVQLVCVWVCVCADVQDPFLIAKVTCLISLTVTQILLLNQWFPWTLYPLLQFFVKARKLDSRQVKKNNFGKIFYIFIVYISYVIKLWSWEKHPQELFIRLMTFFFFLCPKTVGAAGPSQTASGGDGLRLEFRSDFCFRLCCLQAVSPWPFSELSWAFVSIRRTWVSLGGRQSVTPCAAVSRLCIMLKWQDVGL